MKKLRELDYLELGINIDPDELGFEKSSEIKCDTEIEPGQERAVTALKQGFGMQAPGFNIYAAGPRETGLLDTAESLTRSEATKNGSDDLYDWFYCFNFKDNDVPLAVRLGSGEGRILKMELSELLVSLQLHIPKNFEGDTYLTQKEEVIREFNKKRTSIFEELDQTVKKNGFILQAEPAGMMVLPATEDGKPMTPEMISNLGEEEQERLKKTSSEMHKIMGSAMRKLHGIEKEVRENLKNLDRKVTRQTAEELIFPLKKKYINHQILSQWLEDMIEDIVFHMKDFRQGGDASQETQFQFPGTGPDFSRYDINLLVDNSDSSGAPVVVETNPSYPNLFGTLERKAQFGTLLTDFTMIKPGSLHKANGGFLILKIMDLLKLPFSYETLKRTLRNREIQIEDPGEQFGLISTKAIKPAPIPLDVKIILVGPSKIYQLLYNFDEDFRELFKIKAHFDIHVERNAEKTDQFLSRLAEFISEEGLKEIHKTGAAKFIEQSARLAGAKDKLSLKVEELADLLHEAAYWADVENDPLIRDLHVQKAVDSRLQRNSLYRDHLSEMLEKRIIRVETEGEVAGQINGLAVYDLGDMRFGKPARITASFSLGKEGVVNIERKAELSGQIHTKGVMILSGYINSMFALKRPLTLSATICFEQSYGMVDGDSASGAELFALLSVLSGLPLKQEIACTGALSQKGEILPIGGVTEKVEGFFDLCNARGLTKNQGVIIPESNVRELIPASRVVDAVKQGQFHIWPISTVEEGIEILTGTPAGRRTKKGGFTKGSVFAMVDAQLGRLARRVKNFNKSSARENE